MAFTEKFLRTPGVLELAGRHVKRYHVSTADTEIEDSVQKAAYAFLPRLLREPDAETPPASFAVLHRGRGCAMYLLGYSWVWGNVIECRTASAGVPFLASEDGNPESFTELGRPWIGCVWEPPPLGHERSAWVRHMLAPQRPDLAGYLADMLPEGRIGAPE
jgi:hypothetical protein